jgi:hypothetical protein
MNYQKHRLIIILVICFVILVSFIMLAYYFSPRYVKPIRENLDSMADDTTTNECNTQLTARHPQYDKNACSKVIKKSDTIVSSTFTNGIGIDQGGDGGTGKGPITAITSQGPGGPGGAAPCFPKDSNGDPILDEQGNPVQGTINEHGVCVPNRIDPYDYCPQVQKLMHDTWKLKVWYPYYEEDNGIQSDVVKYWDIYDYVADFIRLDHKYGIDCPVSYIP